MPKIKTLTETCFQSLNIITEIYYINAFLTPIHECFLAHPHSLAFWLYYKYNGYFSVFPININEVVFFLLLQILVRKSTQNQSIQICINFFY